MYRYWLISLPCIAIGLLGKVGESNDNVNLKSYSSPSNRILTANFRNCSNILGVLCSDSLFKIHLGSQFINEKVEYILSVVLFIISKTL